MAHEQPVAHEASPAAYPARANVRVPPGLKEYGGSVSSVGVRTFLAVALALHLPLFVYPVLRLGDWLVLPLWLTLLILAPLASSQLLMHGLLRRKRSPAFRLLRRAADFWMGLSPILLMTLLAFEALLVAGLVGRAEAAYWTLGIALALGVASLVNALVPRVKTVAFTARKLARPLRFVQITDVHLGSRSAGFLRRVMAQVKRLKPEFLCITGDLIDAPGIGKAQLASLAALDCPIYFSIGNHERYEDLPRLLATLAELGVITLRSAKVQPREDLAIIGIDDSDQTVQVARELAKIPLSPHRYQILLYHRPRGYAAAQAQGLDLMLSGHTHAGQIFPFNLAVKRLFPKLAGLHEAPPFRLYISQGTGTWGPVMRFGTTPEITLFKITPH